MKASKSIIRKRRTFSISFKKSLVKEFESGRFSVTQLGSLYEIQPMVIYRWIYRYSIFNEKGSRIVEMKDSSTEKLKKLEQRIKELERAVGQKQITIDYLEKMIEVAKEELDIDIKKNFDTPRSTGSGKTENK